MPLATPADIDVLNEKLEIANDALARLGQQLNAAQIELTTLRAFRQATLFSGAPVVGSHPTMIDSFQVQPSRGSRVFALSCGGNIISTIWGKNATDMYDAWLGMPEIPESVKLRRTQSCAE